MNEIKKFAKSVGHIIVGKLTRRISAEFSYDWDTGKKVRGTTKFYYDEAGNEYWLCRNGAVSIVTADGGVI